MKKPYEKWCTAFIQNLAAHLNLAGWEINVEFAAAPKQDCEGCYAHISSDWVYQQASITIYPMGREDFDKGNLEKLTRVLTHELCHILIDPMHAQMTPFLSDTTRPFFNDAMENVTQRISVVIVQNLPKHIIPPR